MKRFQRILYLSQGVGDETDGLKQALSLARNNAASAHVLVIAPPLPRELAGYKSKFEEFLAKSMEGSISAARAALHSPADETTVTVEVESGSAPATRAIRHVLRGEHDLLIKQAEVLEGRSGFTGMDMQLLRQCPCPVWLCRPITARREDISVAVAIDPLGEQPVARDLALKLLRFSRSLADTCNRELEVISCWDYQIEGTLRDSAFIRMPEAEVSRLVAKAEHDHRAALDAIVRESGIGGNVRVHHVRGRADRTIPEIVSANVVDILVMGTVARTGLPGFIIGNTAESILQGIACSVVAMKPHGFVSPVRAY